MQFAVAVQNGFRVINRNWQIILVQIGAMLVSFIGFFILVGIPIAVAFIVFGIDFTEVSSIQDLLSGFRKPAEVLSRYFGLAVLVLASFLLYLLAVLCLGIFIFGGSIGLVGASVRDPQASFSLKAFFSEGRRLFFPLLGFTTAAGFIFVFFAFVLGLFGGAIAAAVSTVKEYDTTLALFLGIFFSIVLILAVFGCTFGTLAVTLYGAAGLTLHGRGPLSALRQAVGYLYRNAGAFYLYCLVFGGYIVLFVLLLFAGYGLKTVPLAGPMVSPIFQFLVNVGQSYLGLVALAAIFTYYWATADGNERNKAGGEEGGSNAGGSIPENDTGASPGPLPGVTPPGKDEPEQGRR